MNQTAWAHDSAAAWCLKMGDNPNLRIALCGYGGDYDLPGWSVEFGKATNGGYGNGAGNDNQRRERIWFSPHCVSADEAEPRRQPWLADSR